MRYTSVFGGVPDLNILVLLANQFSFNTSFGQLPPPQQMPSLQMLTSMNQTNLHPLTDMPPPLGHALSDVPPSPHQHVTPPSCADRQTPLTYHPSHPPPPAVRQRIAWPLWPHVFVSSLKSGTDPMSQESSETCRRPKKMFPGRDEGNSKCSPLEQPHQDCGGVKWAPTPGSFTSTTRGCVSICGFQHACFCSIK